ncbi:hypothetical protein CVT25_015720 [Psilocybe cyanescens]|uniref:Cyanovirin-N domain-containing protein n=1 Tax=Psilocybe cyanescens TaxID=93625 RepID=A0A409X1H6_PSICY|nr:hypothetical protein CVT25_015720 [Psilocybe cyanescens]
MQISINSVLAMLALTGTVCAISADKAVPLRARDDCTCTCPDDNPTFWWRTNPAVDWLSGEIVAGSCANFNASVTQVAATVGGVSCTGGGLFVTGSEEIGSDTPANPIGLGYTGLSFKC